MTGAERIVDMHDLLLDAYGPQGWWPSRSSFETVVGAVLTQGTAWTNVEKAIRALRSAGVLSPEAMTELPHAHLTALIRPAGFFTRKADTLRSLLTKAESEFGGFDGLLSAPPSELRETLLSVRGVGPETADAVLLYAAGHPAFPVDTYARRVLGRHRIIDERAPYDDVAHLVVESLEGNERTLNEFHALVVRVGKDFCRSRPRCRGCPGESDRRSAGLE